MATKPKPTTEGLLPLDFVYAGRRMGKNDKLVDALITLDAEGKAQDRLFFAAERSERVLGGIYTGALFSPTSAQLRKAAFTGKRWANNRDVIEWEARSGAARLIHRRNTLEANEKKRSAIELSMHEVRVVYDDMRRRGDFDGCDALQQVVLQALRRPV